VSWYRHTHESVRDGSPAMRLMQDDHTITLVNEDGDVWVDPSDRWRPIMFEVVAETTAEDILELLDPNPWRV
jgi:hypothetical protein